MGYFSIIYMAGQKCFTCNFIFKELDQFDSIDDWEDKPHEDLKDCVKCMAVKISELYELLNVVEDRFRYDKVMRRKILD
jgi:hypothetical protein